MSILYKKSIKAQNGKKTKPAPSLEQLKAKYGKEVSKDKAKKKIRDAKIKKIDKVNLNKSNYQFGNKKEKEKKTYGGVLPLKKKNKKFQIGGQTHESVTNAELYRRQMQEQYPGMMNHLRSGRSESSYAGYEGLQSNPLAAERDYNSDSQKYKKGYFSENRKT